MPSDRSFWRNVTIIAAVHVAVLGGLARWSSQATRTAPADIVWIDGGTAGMRAAIDVASPPPSATSHPPDEEQRAPQEHETPAETEVVADSDIQLAATTPTPAPTPAATATPKPLPTPKPTPAASPKLSPKPTPRSTPRPSPSSSPKKTLLAKKAEPTPAKKSASTEKPADQPEEDATPAVAESQRRSGSPESAKISVSAGTGGSGGRGSGPGGATQHGWYSKMLHDRFYKEWVQPMTAVAAGTKMSALVKIRIEKDGRVTGFNIVQPSGNVLVDESIAAVGRRITQVDPLPSGLGDSHYEVNMRFELTLAQ